MGSDVSASERPFFSVIVPIFNSEQFVRQTLGSIQSQTFRQFEVIMVDDGSSDTSPALAAGFCRADSRFQLHRTPNRGVCAARNLAASHARADWLATCDDDDTWAPDKLERQWQFITRWNEGQSGPLAALGTDGVMINARGARVSSIHLPQRPWTDALDNDLAMQEFQMINSAVVFRRELFFLVGGYRADYTPTEDADLWVRLMEHGAVANISVPLTHYRQSGSNVSSRRYVDMVLSVYRIRENALRRRSQREELTADQFERQLHLDPQQFARTMHRLRHMMYYNQGKQEWSNRLYLKAARSLLRSFRVAPHRTFAMVFRSRVARSLLGLTPATS